MPFCRGNSSYSTDWKGGLLLLTTWVGRPYLAKIWRMALIFESAVVVFMEPITSGHLEWAWPFYYFAWWVAKSTWTRCHGAVGQDHGRSGEAGGTLRVLLHGWHSRVTFSISWSIFGHQTWLRAIDFMRVIPGWPSCNSVRMVCLKEGGTLERPHIRQPCSTESSCLRVKYGLSSGSVQWLIGQPFCVRNRAFAKQGVPRCVLGWAPGSWRFLRQKLGVVSTAEGPHGRFKLPHLHLSGTEVGALTRRQRWLLQQMTWTQFRSLQRENKGPAVHAGKKSVKNRPKDWVGAIGTNIFGVLGAITFFPLKAWHWN